MASDPDVKGRTPLSAVLRSATEEFEHVRVYPSFLGWGWHIILSEERLIEPTVDEFIARVPLKARNDFLEWNRMYKDLHGFVAAILSTKIDIQRVLGDSPDVRIEDDRPYNEYYIVRTVLDPPLPASEVRELSSQE
jgi:hypothetical protein